MKRIILSMVLGGIVASLVLGGATSRVGRPSLVPQVHAQEGCSVASLSGTYAFYRQGTTSVATASANALASVGIFSADGAGNSVAPGHQVISKNGVISDFNQGVGIGGIYRVDPDCTGQFFMEGATTPFADFVVVDGGRGLYAMSLGDSNAVIEVARRTQTLEEHRNE